jgi:serine protease
MTALTGTSDSRRTRRHRLTAIASGASALVMITGAGMTPALASASHAARARPAGTYTPGSPNAGENMVYNGGPVQHHPKVYLVYWGSQWSSDPAGVKPYMRKLFHGLGTSTDTWSRITTQYKDSAGPPTFTGAVFGGAWTDSAKPEPSSPSVSAISAEANRAASHFGVAGQPDAQIAVMSAQGTHPDGWPNSGFCAWHDYNGSVSFTNMPYQLDAPAGSRCPNQALGGKLDAFSIVEGHEYAESITDPQAGNGWVAPNGEEIGDQCEANFQKVTLPTGTFALQPLWSNQNGGCVIKL